jgi:hypothetical protein
MHKKPLTLEWFRAHGRRGAKLRSKVLTAARRSEIARKAAKARWAKKGGK